MLIITSWVLNYVTVGFSFFFFFFRGSNSVRISPLSSVPCCWFLIKAVRYSGPDCHSICGMIKIPLLKGHKRQARAQIMQPLARNGDISIYTINQSKFLVFQIILLRMLLVLCIKNFGFLEFLTFLSVSLSFIFEKNWIELNVSALVWTWYLGPADM